MCGIFGTLGSFDSVLKKSFTNNLCHRGPDDSGTFEDVDTRVLLGHTRLSIIDLSSQAHQPMTDPSGRFTIVFNGEIYNYQEIRQELELSGISFKSNSDTETLLLGYAFWGADIVPKLRGMFAFAVYDGLLRELFLARDHFGIKPLLYSFQKGNFVFCSELKPLLASGGVEKTTDPEAVDELFACGSVRQPKTIIKDVFHLLPGHTMRVGADGRHSIAAYYRFPSSDSKILDISYPEAVSATRTLLEKATRYNLVADVDVGAFLSGGVDSTAIVALMSQYVNKPIQAFSIGFEGQSEVFDESLLAMRTAEQIGADFHRVVVGDQQITELFDDFIRALDQPSIDGINTYLVSRFACKHVKVALSGLGGDEIFAGYPHFSFIPQACQKKVMPWDHLARLLHRIRPNRFTGQSVLKGIDVAQALSLVRTVFPSHKRDNMLAGSFRSANNNGLAMAGLTPLQQISQLELTGYLRNTLLRDTDAVSMWHSLEIRPVLLDHELIEFVYRLPDDFKVREGRLKAVLVDAVKDIIPAAVWQSPKRGFEMPFSHWLNGRLNDRFAGLVETDVAKKLFNENFRVSLSVKIKREKNVRADWLSLVFLQWLTVNGVDIGK